MADGVGVNGVAIRRTVGGPAARAVGTDRQVAWLLVLPAALLILALSIYPLIYSVWVAFVNYDFQIPGHAFVGLQNFSEIVNDPIARRSLVNTVILSAACVAVEFALGLLLALAMLERFRGRGLVMPVLIVPLFISPVIVGQFWSLILQPPFGPTNYLLGLLLGRPVDISWLTQTPWNFIAIVTADVWQWTPFMFVILLAGLSAIAPEMFEAAELDGASRSQTFWYVTLPQLKPLILLALTFRLLDAVKLFDVIYVMTGGGPGASTYTASFYLYQIGFQQFHLSKATAGSWIFLLLSAVLIMALVRRLLRPETR
jgi:multiple sugar transport system permease protein